MYARTNRCYIERGSRINYVRSSIPHRILMLSSGVVTGITSETNYICIKFTKDFLYFTLNFVTCNCTQYKKYLRGLSKFIVYWTRHTLFNDAVSAIHLASVTLIFAFD